MDEHIHDDLLTRIAWLYFYENLSQQEIGDLLGVPRIKVTRLLKVIKERKIVEVKIDRKHLSVFGIEKELKEATGLGDVTVVPTGKDPAANVAYATAARFMEACRKYRTIGIGSSRIVSAALDKVQPLAKKKVERLVSLTGNVRPNFSANPFWSLLATARLLEIDCYSVWAPSVATTKEMAELLRADYIISTVLKMANEADFSLLGIGDIKNSLLLWHGLIGEKEVAEIISRGAVGEIFGHFYAFDGSRIPSGVEERTVTADLPMKCPALAVAYGESKARPLVGAIRGGLVTGVIVDERTASAVLNSIHG
jgi:DNA-binding transcriptional regulator LsrR (DeoR family)